MKIFRTLRLGATLVCLAALLFPGSAAAQTSSAASNDSAVRELQDQVRELRSLVEQMRSENVQSRAEMDPVTTVIVIGFENKAGPISADELEQTDLSPFARGLSV